MEDNGDIFVWGDNHWGQLGLQDFEMRHTPAQLPLHTIGNVVSFSCGYAHTAAVFGKKTIINVVTFQILEHFIHGEVIGVENLGLATL